MALNKQWASINLYFLFVNTTESSCSSGSVAADYYCYYVYKLVNFRIENKNEEIIRNDAYVGIGVYDLDRHRQPLPSVRVLWHTCDDRKLKRKKLLRFVSSLFSHFYYCESMARRESIGFSLFKFFIFMRDATMRVHHVVMFVWFVSCLLNFYVPVLCGFFS